jgi:peptidoglycan/LPS O-acetylase OafA/YrhL
MGITWSLAVEEQFYLLLPLAIRYFSRVGVIRLMVGTIVLAPVIRTILLATGNTYIGPYTLLPCRMDALGLGVLTAMACRNQKIWEWFRSHRRNGYLVFVILGAGVEVLAYRPEGRLMTTVGYTWLALFYTSLLVLVVAEPGRIERGIFRSFVLVSLGTVAYALYIFHVGVNSLLHYFLLGGSYRIQDFKSLLVSLLSLCVVIGLAALSWRVLEKPLIRRGHSKYHYVYGASEAPSI